MNKNVDENIFCTMFTVLLFMLSVVFYIYLLAKPILVAKSKNSTTAGVRGAGFQMSVFIFWESVPLISETV